MGCRVFYLEDPVKSSFAKEDGSPQAPCSLWDSRGVQTSQQNLWPLSSAMTLISRSTDPKATSALEQELSKTNSEQGKELSLSSVHLPCCSPNTATFQVR